MSSLKDRLRLAMDGPPRVSQASLARACKIAAPSVNNWVSGKSQEIKGPNLLAAARLLNVNPEWLASGRGAMRPLSESGMRTESFSRMAQESHCILKDRLEQAMEGPPRVSQAALAKACGITLSSVNDWARGKTRKIEGANLLAAARFLGVSPEWLATGRSSMRAPNDSEMSSENVLRMAQESYRITLDEDSLHEAIGLLEHDESQAGVYSPRARTRRLAELYAWVSAEGGRLSNASNREFEQQVLDRRQGVSDGGSNRQ